MTLGIMKKFGRKTDGVAAIESVFIIPVFFALVFSTFEVGHFFFKASMIEQAAGTAARSVKVGKAFKPGAIEDALAGQCDTGKRCFFDQVCESVAMFGDCSKHLSVEVALFESFDTLLADDKMATCPNEPGYDADAQLYQPGDKNDIIRVRICFTVKTFNPALGINLRQNDDGTKSVIAVQVIRNEPYLSDEEINPNEGLS